MYTRLLIFFVAGCSGVTIQSDDTSMLEESDVNADADADADADTDANHTGTWSGAVEGFNEQVNDDFCAGALLLELSEEGTLEGSGFCLLIAGPGKGEQFDLQVEALLDDDDISGSILLAFQQDETVSMEGVLEEDRMSLSWDDEISTGGNGPDGGTIAFTASLAHQN